MIVCRVVVGAGKRFFPDRVRLKLELADEHQFRNGVVFLNEAELAVSTLTVSEEVSPALPSPRWFVLHLRVSGAQEPIAYSRNRDDQFRTLGVLLQFFPETRHMHIYRAGQCVFRVPPDGPQEFATRQRTSGALYEIAQQLKFTCREVDRFTIAGHRGTAYVDLNRSKLMNAMS